MPLPAPPLARETARSTGPVTIVISGNRRFSLETLRGVIAEPIAAIEQSGLSPAAADDIAFFLGTFYRRNGFAEAEIQASIPSPQSLRLVIREGRFTALGRVRLEGAHAFSEAELAALLTTALQPPKAPQAAAGETAPEVTFAPNEIQAGVDRIRGRYREAGFLDVAIGEPEIAFSADRSRADVSLTIREGTPYRFGPLRFEGDVLFFPQKPLLDTLKVFTEKPFTPLAVTNLERKVLYFYRSHGYFDAKVRTEADPAQAKAGAVPVTFQVQAGAVYRFDGVTQSGLRKLRPSFLPARFASLQGTIYNPAALEERYRLLMSSGLFNTLKLTQRPTPNHEVELHFDVEEAKSRELGFSLGYGTLEGGIIGTHTLDRDLFGNGRPLSIDLELAERLVRGEFIYTDPWFLDSPYTLRLRLYELSQDLNDYTKLETGLRTEFSRKLFGNLEATGFLLTRQVNLNNTSGIDERDFGLSNYRADSLGLSLTLDRRDSVLNPTKGWIVNATTDVALNILGSSLDFLRGTARASYYLPVGPTLLALGVRGGVIYPMNRKDQVPIDERFFNGGSHSVRSYGERNLGPMDSGGRPVGGETFANANIEDLFPIIDALKGALFFDYGSVGRHLGSGVGQTGCAIGAGLRYQLPIGPVRLDYGINPFQENNRHASAVHFSFGFAF
jgi:outer membrane protein assembly complex protein YaeT